MNQTNNIINPERRDLLDRFTDLLIKEYKAENQLHLIFICTHNSRRSQLAEILAQSISCDLGISNINTYSGGTEVTAFNERMVQALIDCGYSLDKVEEGKNPKYKFKFDGQEKICFSKLYDASFNPQENFIAITVCSDAEKNCPLVLGAKHRFHLPYKDPKEFDGSEVESQMYFEKVQEIRKEFNYIFSSFQRTLLDE